MCYDRYVGKEWAKSCLQMTMRRAYQLKDRFSGEQQDRIADLLNGLKQKGQQLAVKNIEAHKHDGKIRQDPLSNTGGFTDGRQVKVTVGSGCDKWASKQDF